MYHRCPPLPQNLEVVYRQYLQKDGRRGLDWTEVAVCLIQDGLSNAHESVLAASTVQVRRLADEGSRQHGCESQGGWAWRGLARH